MVCRLKTCLFTQGINNSKKMSLQSVYLPPATKIMDNFRHSRHKQGNHYVLLSNIYQAMEGGHNGKERYLHDISIAVIVVTVV